MRQGYRNYSVFGYRPLQASGGTTSDILVNGRPFRVHRFLSTGSSTFTMHNQGNTEFIEYLVIGGGGGGGSRHGGGGGAGGVVSGSLTMDGTSQYSVTVGAGGSGGVGNGTPSGSGGQSSFAGYLALGGGGGGQWAENLAFRKDNGDSGGSGGGASNPVGTTANGGNSDFGQGFRGGNQPNNGAAQWMGAGGGGAGGVGGDASNGTSGTGGNGGVGISNSITGSAVMYAGGGGGGGRDNLGTAGTGGAGGGGNGGSGATPTATPQAGSPGLANTGGGGGGARDFPGGGAGGSGVVIVRYPIGPEVPLPYMTATGGTINSYTQNTSSTNLATNPNFETDTNSWSTSDGSISRSIAIKYSGTASLRFNPSNAGATFDYYKNYTTSQVVSGQSYSASFRLKTDTIGQNVSARLNVRGTESVDSYVVGDGTWQLVKIENVIAGSGSAQISLTVWDEDGNGLNIDEVLIEQATTVGDYFDGSFPNCTWSGTPNASISTKAESRTYRSHTFTTVGSSTFNVSALGAESYGNFVEYMLVGGGGSGRSAGGGAGGAIVSSATIVPSIYNVFVGSGGPRQSLVTPSNGGSTTLTGTGIAATTAFGGGMGGSSEDAASINGNYGGSGGGAASFWTGSTYTPGTIGLGEPGQGNNGSPSYNSEPGSGGGATQAGVGYTDTIFIGGVPSAIWITSGGNGISNNYFDGTTRYYAGGGKGVSESSSSNNIYGGGGTSGPPSYEGLDGTPNTGGGGGGSGGAGGSGIVVIRYRIA